MANELYITKQEHNDKIRSLNYKWTIGVISSLLIISIATSLVFWLCKDEYCQLLEVLDMISTLLAITLSVFSILFSYSTSQDASKALSSVASEVAKIETTNTQIGQHMSTILDHIGTGSLKAESDPKKGGDVDIEDVKNTKDNKL